MPTEELTYYEALAHKLSRHSDDLKIEVLLAELMENEILDDQKIRIQTLGLFRRSHRKELDGVEVVREEDSKTPKFLKFNIWREGIYDALPKGIFHDLRKEAKPLTVEKSKEEVVLREKERQAAKDFFFPIEQAFFRLRMQVESEERSVLGGFNQKMRTQELAAQLWKIDIADISLSKAVPLLYFLPYVFHYKGDYKSLGKIFSFLLGSEATIEQVEESVIQVDDDLQCRLGDAYLGNDFVIGDSFPDGIPRLRIHFQALTAEQTAAFVPGRPQHKLLSILCRFLLPFVADWDVTPDLERSEQHFFLSETQAEKTSHTPQFNDILGFTTYLS